MIKHKRPTHISPGGRKLYNGGKPRKTALEPMDDTPEYSISMPRGVSNYWSPRLDETTAFGPVTVRNGAGEVIRVIEVDALRREWRAKEGNVWNNSLFHKQNSDKV